MKKISVTLYMGLCEEPDRKLNYVVYNRKKYDFLINKKTTFRDIFTILIRDINDSYNDPAKNYCFSFESKTYIKAKKIRAFHSDSRIIIAPHAFNVPIQKLIKLRKNCNLSLIYYPDFEGAGCWGESNGLKFIINTEENNHMSLPHIHVKSNDGKRSNRINLINLNIIKDKNNNCPLKGKEMKHAIKIIKQRQLDLLNYWNDYTNCKMIVDLTNFINTKSLTLIPRNINYSSCSGEKIKNNRILFE